MADYHQMTPAEDGSSGPRPNDSVVDSDCYCAARATDPAVAAELQDLPDGYCGLCEVCGAPGHARAHPRRPVSGAWCDEHWASVIEGRPVPVVALLLGLGVVGWLVLRFG